MTKPIARTFAHFVLLGFVLIGLGYGIAAVSALVSAPSPVQSSRLECVTGNDPIALCALLVRR